MRRISESEVRHQAIELLGFLINNPEGVSRHDMGKGARALRDGRRRSSVVDLLTQAGAARWAGKRLVATDDATITNFVCTLTDRSMLRSINVRNTEPTSAAIEASM